MLSFRRMRILNHFIYRFCKCVFFSTVTYVVLSSICYSQTQIEAVQTSKNSKAIALKSELDSLSAFINAETLFVAKIDFEKIDLNQQGETLANIFRSVVNKVGFDQKSIESSVQEFEKTVAQLKISEKEIITQAISKIGFTKIYYVVQTAKCEGACFIIPAQSMTTEQIDNVKSFAESHGLNCALYKKRFLIASHLSLKEIGSYYRSFIPSPNDKMEDFFNLQSKQLGAFYANRFKIRTLLKNLSKNKTTTTLNPVPLGATSSEKQSLSIQNTSSNDSFSLKSGQTTISQPVTSQKYVDPIENASRCIKNAVEIFDSSFVEGFGFVDASNLRVLINLKFTTSTNAGKFKQEIEKSSDEVCLKSFDFLQERIEQLDLASSLPLGISLAHNPIQFVKEYRILPVLREIVIGELHNRLPKQNDSSLILDYSLANELGKIGPNTLAVLGSLFLINSTNQSNDLPSKTESINLDNVFDSKALDISNETSPQSAVKNK